MKIHRSPHYPPAVEFGPWLVSFLRPSPYTGAHYGIRVYRDNRPILTFALPFA
jgi:hypothetical protein